MEEYPAITFADLDSDNDNDLFLHRNFNTIGIYWNTGSDITSEWSEFDPISIPRRNNWNGNLADIDGDGDFDIVMCGQNDSLKMYRNIGTEVTPQFATTPVLLCSLDVLDYSFADLDNDYDADMVAIYRSGSWDAHFDYFENVGTANKFQFVKIDSVLPYFGSEYTPHLADADNDGDADLFMMNEAGEIYFVENVTPTSLAGESETVIREFALLQNYPNPFNPKTVIGYTIGTGQLSAFSNVELSIYNLLGQKVATLVSKKQAAGYYKVEWDATGFSSGIYFYKLDSRDFVQTRKLIILR